MKSEQILEFSVQIPVDRLSPGNNKLYVLQSLLGWFPPVKDGHSIEITEMGIGVYDSEYDSTKKDAVVWFQIVRGRDIIPPNMEPTTNGVEEIVPDEPVFTYPDGSWNGYSSTFAPYDEPHKFKYPILIDGKTHKSWDIAIMFPFHEHERYEKNDWVRLVVKYTKDDGD